ncbi:MAG TPA: septum site-determining protein MinC [Polyangia bacterium]|nr:septum site-determining protein MinC [Polyangia bacterium]
MAFDLKGTMAPLTVLRLRTLDLTLIERQLRIKIAQLPQLFLDAPVMLDLGALEGGGAGLAFLELVRMLRLCKLVPVAVANIADDLRDKAAAVGLGVLQPTPARVRGDGRSGDAPGASGASGASGSTSAVEVMAPGDEPAAQRTGATAASASATPAPGARSTAAHAGPLVIKQPVRSGQVIYAQNADLVVLAPVNPGAQVIADGHIHVYAPLRGRAIAGVQGLLGARIFCQRLEAELVAISGAYLTADDIPADVRGHAAQVYFDDGECRIIPL